MSMADRFLLDGEIVMPQGRTFLFDSLLQWVHSCRESREKFYVETSVLLRVFDLFASPRDDVLVAQALTQRRGGARGLRAKAPVHRSANVPTIAIHH